MLLWRGRLKGHHYGHTAATTSDVSRQLGHYLGLCDCIKEHVLGEFCHK